MANKKFYYHTGKNNARKTQAAKASRQDGLSTFSPEQLSMSLADLGLSEETAKLLEKNKIVSARELCVCTEKDMFRVQGLNKRILFEIKKALQAHGMRLFEVPADAVAPANAAGANVDDRQKSQKQQQKKADKREQANPQRFDDKPRERFGLADRKGADASTDAHRQQKREKLKEPLPPEQWRKVMKGGKWGFSNGFTTVIPPMYDEVYMFKEGLASVEIDGKCGYIDTQNNVVIPLMYDIAMSFSEGLAMVSKDEKCGYIDKNNEVVIDFLYDAATPFEGDEAKVKQDGKWATLQRDGSLKWI